MRFVVSVSTLILSTKSAEYETPDYFWFDPDTLEFAGFHLVDGEYQPLEPNPQGYLWSHQLGLYLGIYQNYVQFFTREQKLVPTPEEDA